MIIRAFKLFFWVAVMTFFHLSLDAKPAIKETEMVLDGARILRNSSNTSEKFLKYKIQENVSKRLPFDAGKWVNIKIRVG